jgi:hypothetical protein
MIMPLLRRCAFLVAVAAGAAGCAYRTPAVHLPAAIPPVAPGALDVTEVTVVADGDDVDPEDAADVREWTAALLAKAANERGAAHPAGAAGGPARVHVHVELVSSRPGFFLGILKGGPLTGMIALPGWLLGGEIVRERLRVGVTLETGGRTFTGEAWGDKAGSLYVPARRRALAIALDRALAAAAAEKTIFQRATRPLG